MTQYESDARAIARAIDALSDGEIIEHGTARTIASGYNDFRTAHFVSTGYMPRGDAQWLMDALRRGVDAQTLKNDAPALTALMTYLLSREESGNTGRIDGWSDMWVAKREIQPTHCACRDCMDTTVSSDTNTPQLCTECKGAGCQPWRTTNAPANQWYGAAYDCQRDEAREG